MNQLVSVRFTKSLRAKVLLSALLPVTLVLVLVAIIALIAYEREAGKVVQERDAELARVSVARLSEGLSRLSLILQTVANDEDIQSLEEARMRRALERDQAQLFVFDAGVVIHDDRGIAIWSDPFAFGRREMGFPVPSEFDKVLATLSPSFSNVFRDEISGEDVVLLTLPIVARGPEFKGVVTGMSTLNSLLLSTVYSEVLEITGDSERFAYLVDGNGRIIFHRNPPQLGTDISAIESVNLAIGGQAGAVIADGPEGKIVISGFAPVPNTDWAVITQEEWQNVVGYIRNFSALLLGILVVGGILSSGLIFFTIGRILKPVKDLADGAKRIAGGDFDHTITAETGDEIQALAQQFNSMAGALKVSYAGLELRVAERTRDLRQSEERLRTVVSSAPIVLFAVDQEGMFTFSQGKGLGNLGLEQGALVGSSVYDLYRDVPEILDDIRRALAGEEPTSAVEVGGLTFETMYAPVRGENDEIVGITGVSTDITERKRAEDELRTAHQRLLDIVEFLPDATFVIDDEKRVIAWNRALEELTGVQKQDIIGQGDFAYAVPFYGERRPALVDLIGVEHSEVESQYDYVERNGSTLLAEAFFPSLRGGVGAHVRATASPLLDDMGNRYGAIESIRDITEHKETEEALRDLTVLEERNRMAREIHDTLAQGFTGIVLQLEAAEQGMEESPDEVPYHLRLAKSLARESLQEARRSVWNLLPHALEDRSLNVALREEVHRFGAEGHEKASWSLSGDIRQLPSDVQATLLRICQESLTNVRRHARATEVSVDLTFLPDAVCLAIQDNGAGFDPQRAGDISQQGGVGLTSMEQRARLVEGNFAIKSQKGKGTLIEVTIPTTEVDGRLKFPDEDHQIWKR